MFRNAEVYSLLIRHCFLSSMRTSVGLRCSFHCLILTFVYGTDGLCGSGWSSVALATSWQIIYQLNPTGLMRTCLAPPTVNRSRGVCSYGATSPSNWTLGCRYFHTSRLHNVLIGIKYQSSKPPRGSIAVISVNNIMLLAELAGMLI